MVWDWAARWARKAIRVAHAAVQEPQAPTLAAVLERALREDEVEHKPATCRTRASLLRSLRPHWDLSRQVRTFTRVDAIDLKAAFVAKRPTFNGIRRWLHHVFADAVADGLHPGPNPFDRVPEYPNEARRIAFSAGEVRRIVAEVEELRRAGGASEQACDALLVLLGTGMRAMEVASLTWDEVDLDKAIVSLRDSKTGARRFPISSSVVALVRRQRRCEGNPHVFASSRSDTGHIKPPGAAFRKVRKSLGLPEKATLHSLRATWLTHAVRSGRSKDLAMQAIGDKSAKIVDKHYLALESEDLRATVEATAADLLGDGGAE